MGESKTEILSGRPELISNDDTTKKGKRDGNTAFMHRFIPLTQDFDVSKGKRSSPIPKKTMPVSVTKESIFSYRAFNFITSMIYMLYRGKNYHKYSRGDVMDNIFKDINAPRVTMYGQHLAIVEGFNRIKRFERESIILVSRHFEISLTGFDMEICALSRGYIEVKGRIVSADMERMTAND